MKMEVDFYDRPIGGGFHDDREYESWYEARDLIDIKRVGDVWEWREQPWMKSKYCIIHDIKIKERGSCEDDYVDITVQECEKVGENTWKGKGERKKILLPSYRQKREGDFVGGEWRELIGNINGISINVLKRMAGDNWDKLTIDNQ